MANWNDLPDEMKEMVVEEMTYETRNRLKMCSKRDKYLVESIKMNYDEVKIYANKLEQYIQLAIALRTKKKPKLEFYMSLSAVTSGSNAGHVSVERNYGKENEHEKIIGCSSGEEGVKTINRFFESIVFDRNLCYRGIGVYITCPGFLDGSEFTMNPKFAEIKGFSGEVTRWLNNIASGVEIIFLKKTDDERMNEKIEGLGSIPAIINATVVNISRDCDINDEQLAKFKSNVIWLGGKSNVTGKGINLIMKKVIANDYPEICVNIALDEIVLQTWNDIINGLDIKVTDERDSPEDEHGQVTFGIRRGYVEMNQGKQLGVLVINAEKKVYMTITTS